MPVVPRGVHAIDPKHVYGVVTRRPKESLS
jgi:hypothetical protein